MTLAAGLTLLVIVVALGLMMADIASPDLVLLASVIVLTATGILTPVQAFAGFGNPGMLTVGALFVVAAGLRETGAVTMVTAGLLGRPSGVRAALVRLVFPVVIASSVLNNTTIVASLMAAVHDWGRRIGVPPSQLLMPLSFASILGGTITLFGTSTNLVVAGMVADLVPTRDDLRPIGMFDITPLGLVVAVVGALTVVLLAPSLLPDRDGPKAAPPEARRFIKESHIPEGSRFVGKTLEKTGLLNHPGATLVRLIRADGTEVTGRPDVELAAGDTLVFRGEVEAIVALYRLPGLSSAHDQITKLEGDRHERMVIECVVSPRNALAFRSVRDGFRHSYNAVILAAAPAGERQVGRLADMILKPGDVLILEAHPDFLDAQRMQSDFYLVSALEGAAPPRNVRAGIALVVLVLLVATVAFEVFPAVVAAMLAAAAMVFSRCCTLEEAREAIDLRVLVAIACAFALGRAMQVTGVDTMLAGLMVDVGVSTPFAALVVVYVGTTLLTEVITNNAAAVLAVPIALSLADRVDADPMGYMFTIMMAASASFLTPIGYQTNMMVYGAGGYRALDFPKLGLPLSFTAGIATIAMVPWLWPL